MKIVSEYRYDGLDRLVSRLDSDANVTLFFRDGLSEQIALETNAAGTVTTRYLTDAYSTPRGKIDIGNSTGRSYYMTDPRGNVTQMIARADQKVKAAFNYGPYGDDKGTDKVSEHWDSRLKFQMAPKDPTTGSYTIGPRVMDPGINRFVGADMYVGAAANLGLQVDPLTGNRYLYAGANPIGMIDDGHGPFGIDCIGTTNDDGGCGWAKSFKKDRTLAEPIALAVRKDRPGDDGRCIPTPRGLTVEQQKALIQAGKYCMGGGAIYEPAGRTSGGVGASPSLTSPVSAGVGLVTTGACVLGAGIATGPAAPAGIWGSLGPCGLAGSAVGFAFEESASLLTSGEFTWAPVAGFGAAQVAEYGCRRLAKGPVQGACAVAGPVIGLGVGIAVSSNSSD